MSRKMSRNVVFKRRTYSVVFMLPLRNIFHREARVETYDRDVAEFLERFLSKHGVSVENVIVYERVDRVVSRRRPK